MAVVVWIGLPGATTEQYDQLNDKAGISNSNLPEGLICHCVFEQNGMLNISDLWESKEQFEAFFTPLMPLMEDIFGHKPQTQPVITEAHNYFVNKN